MERFIDRHDAGQQLAKKLEFLKKQPDLIVLGLARGGVPVAFEISQSLGVPLEVLIVRKLGVPNHEELTMGAIASGGMRVLNQDIIKNLGLDNQTIESEVSKESAELARREINYGGTTPFLALKDKTLIVVDDGIATGATMRVAIKALRQQNPSRIIIATPTCARDTYHALWREVDEVVCLAVPDPYIAVGLWYEHFPQTSDTEVKQLLERSKSRSY